MLKTTDILRSPPLLSRHAMNGRPGLGKAEKEKFGTYQVGTVVHNPITRYMVTFGREFLGSVRHVDYLRQPWKFRYLAYVPTICIHVD